MKPLAKNQVPQVVVLGLLCAAIFGYFIFKMVVPTPAAAGVRTAPAATVAKAATPASGNTGQALLGQATPGQAIAAPSSVASAAQGAATLPLVAPPPSPGMHDPFAPEITSQASTPQQAPAVRTASMKTGGDSAFHAPSVQPLPPMGVQEVPSGVPGGSPSAAPAPPAAPSWTVTGVVASGAEHMAILRSGDARRFVRQGDVVDGDFRVASVNSNSVVLQHGQNRFTLMLGGVQPAPVPAAGLVPYTPAVGKPAAKLTQPALSALPPPTIALSEPRIADSASTSPTVKVADYIGEKTPSLSLSGTGADPLSCGALAPDFSLCDLNGEAFSLSEYRGTTVVLDFWSARYPNAKRSLESMNQLQTEYADKGVSVVAINSSDTQVAMQATLGSRDWTYPMLFDPSASKDSVAARFYHTPDVPTFYVVDQTGRIAGAFIGFSRTTASNIKATLAGLGIA